MTATGADAFVWKLDATGNLLWVRRTTASNSDELAYGVSVDDSGNVVVVGTFEGTADFDPGAGSSVLASAGNSAFVWKFDAAGNFLWARQTSDSDGSEIARDVSADGAGNVVVGYFDGTADFDPGVGIDDLTVTAEIDAFVWKLDAAGNHLWARRTSNSTSLEDAVGVSTDAAGNVIVVGFFVGSASFDPGAGAADLNSFDADAFVWILDASGNYLRSRQTSNSTGDEYASGVGTDGAGNVVVVGHFYGTADFDPGAGTAQLTAAGAGNAAFVWKLRNVSDSTAPGVALITAAGPAVNGGIVVTVTLSEESADFAENDLSATNGTIVGFTGSGKEYSFTLTPTLAGAFSVSVGAGAFQDAEGNKNKVGATLARIADFTAPSLTFGSAAGDPVNGGFTVTVVLDETSPDFDATDLTTVNGMVSGFSGGGKNYSFTLTPIGDGTVSVSVAAGKFHDAAGNLGLPSATFTRQADLTPPTVNLSSVVGNPTNGTPWLVLADLSESSSDFDATDLGATNGTVSGFSGGGKNYSFTLTPTAAGTVSVTIAAGKFHDAAGNANLSPATLSRTVDLTPPTVNLSSVAGNPVNGAPLLVLVDLSETSIDFDATDLSATNGTISAFSGGGKNYSFTLTPSAEGTVSVTIAAGKFHDAAGNANLSPATLSRTVDLTPPTVNLSSVAGDPVSGVPLDIVVELGEASGDFDATDLSPTNGTISAFFGSGKSYSFTLTPLAGGTVSVTVAAGAFHDAAGNANLTPATLSRTVDLSAPTVSLSSAAGNPVNGAPLVVLVDLSETSSDFDATDLGATNGTISAFSGGGKNYSFTLTPIAAGTVSVTIAAGKFHDSSGNANLSPATLSRTVDLTPPTVTLSSSAPAPFTGAVTITATLSEASTNFDLGDFAVSNGSLTSFSGSGKNYSLTLTPAAAGAFSVTVLANSFTDAAGNFNASATTLVRRPDLRTVTFSLDPAATQWGNTIDVQYSISNGGVAAAQASVARVYLSANTTIGVSDDLRSTFAVPELAAGATYGGTIAVTLPGLPGSPPGGFADPGTAYLGLLLDPANLVDESNEANNASTGLGADYAAVTILRGGEVESNNTQPLADSITLNTTIRAQVGTAGDVDWFEFDVVEAGWLDLTVTRDGSSLDARVELYNGESLLVLDGLRLAGGGLLIGSDDRTVGNPDPRVVQYLLPGTYWAKVSSGATGPTAVGAYRLTLDFDPNPNNPYDPAVNLPSRAQVGLDPSRIRAADFNRDGILDLVTSNRGEGTVSVLLGIGDGTFETQRNYVTGVVADSVVVLEFNDDDRPDPAVFDRVAGKIALLPGFGDGGFAENSIVYLTAPGTVPYDLAAGDLNADGYDDLVIADRGGSGSLRILYGRSPSLGSPFEPPTTLPLTALPTGAAVVDVDEDGRLDLVVRRTGPVYDVLYGLGNDSNGAATFTAVGGGTVSEAIVDHAKTLYRLRVPQAFSVTDVNVQLNLEHTWNEDLDVFLIAPDGTRIRLFQDIGGDGDDFSGTILDDEAAVPITSGTVPFTGSFRPQSPLSGLDGKGSQGIWTLEITDDTPADAGTLLDWSLVFDNDPLKTYTLPSVYDLEGWVGGKVVDADFNRDGDPDIASLELLGTGPTNASSIFIGAGIPQDTGAVADLARSNYWGIFQLFGFPQYVAAEDFFDGYFYLTADRNAPNGARSTPQFADLTGDDIDDVLVLSLSGRVLLREGLGDGRFSAPIELNEGGQGARAVTIVSAGENARVATVDLLDNRASIYERAPDKTWSVVDTTETGMVPVRLATGDLNGDDLIDLVSADALLGTVTIYLGTPSGDFEPSARIKVAVTVADVALVDLDGDLRLDIVTTGVTSNDVSVLLNRTTGPSTLQFAAEIRYRAGVGEYGEVETVSNIVNPQVEMLFGLTDAFPTQYFAYSDHETTMTLNGLFDGDALPDVIAVNRGDGTLTLLAGIGGGRLADPRLILSEPGASLAAAEDFDDDGDLDLAVLSEANALVSIWLNDGHGVFTRVQTLPAGNSPSGITVSLIDDDDVPDLAIGTQFGDVLSFRGVGDGTFRPYERTDGQVLLAVVDVDGDGTPDAITADGSLDRVRVRYRTPGTNDFSDGFQHNAQVQAPGASELYDLNGDGLGDLVIANGGRNAVLVYLGLGGGEFAAGQSFYSGSNPVDFAVSDLNGDNTPDLAVVNQGSNDVSVLFGHKTGGVWDGFVTGPRLDVGRNPTGIVLLDVIPDGQTQGDGILDMAVTTEQGGTGENGALQLLYGVGSGFFNDQSPTTIDLPGNDVGGLVLDTNLQGYVTVGGGVFRFDATNFTGGTFFGGLGATSVIPYDFTGDGVIDLIVGSGDGVRLFALTDGDLLAESQFVAIDALSSLALADLGNVDVLTLYVVSEGDEVVTVLDLALGDDDDGGEDPTEPPTGETVTSEAEPGIVSAATLNLLRALLSTLFATLGDDLRDDDPEDLLRGGGGPFGWRRIVEFVFAGYRSTAERVVGEVNRALGTPLTVRHVEDVVGTAVRTLPVGRIVEASFTLGEILTRRDASDITPAAGESAAEEAFRSWLSFLGEVRAALLPAPEDADQAPAESAQPEPAAVPAPAAPGESDAAASARPPEARTAAPVPTASAEERAAVPVPAPRAARNPEVRKPETLESEENATVWEGEVERFFAAWSPPALVR